MSIAHMVLELLNAYAANGAFLALSASIMRSSLYILKNSRGIFAGLRKC